MATTRTMLRASAQRLDSPGEVLKRVNDVIVRDIPPNMFITCLYAILDLKSGVLRYANAGHDLPYRRRSTSHGGGGGGAKGDGDALGAATRDELRGEGDNTAKGRYGIVLQRRVGRGSRPPLRDVWLPRLQGLVGAHRSDGPAMVNFLLTELRRFTGQEWEQEDDITLVTLDRSETS